MFQLTHHATLRIAERGLLAEDLAAALDGRWFEQYDRSLLIVDPRSRVGVVVDPDTHMILTAYRLTKKQIKQRCSRGSEYRRNGDYGW